MFPCVSRGPRPQCQHLQIQVDATQRGLRGFVHCIDLKRQVCHFTIELGKNIGMGVDNPVVALFDVFDLKQCLVNIRHKRETRQTPCLMEVGSDQAGDPGFLSRIPW